MRSSLKGEEFPEVEFEMWEFEPDNNVWHSLVNPWIDTARGNDTSDDEESDLPDKRKEHHPLGV